MIEGLRKLLEGIEPWTEITSIIPGRIKRTKGAGVPLQLTVQVKTVSGLKCLARRSGQIQEVFFVSHAPEALSARLETLEHSSVRRKHSSS